MSRYTPCSVPGCDDRKSSRHRFPNPTKDIERFYMWLQLIDNPKLGQMDPIRVYNNFRVCHQHFTTDDKSSNKLLKHTTVPSQNLPSKIDFLDSVPPSTPTSCTAEDLVHNQQCSSFEERCVTPTQETSSQMTFLKDLGVTKSANLTPKAKRMYVIAKNLQAKHRMYKSRNVALKDRLQAAKNMLIASHTESGENSLKYYMQQLLKKTGKPQGRRYNDAEKLMCLTLYKASGSAYRILAKWFDLPSPRTISRILQMIPIEPGLSNFVFQQLEKSVSKMMPKEKVCFLMFDEVSLQPHVEYRKLDDEIVGLDNNKIIDHALVFMVKGVLANWKQVVAYTFCKGTTTSANLEVLVKAVLEKLITSGLNVVATVCDQIEEQ